MIKKTKDYLLVFGRSDADDYSCEGPSRIAARELRREIINISSEIFDEDKNQRII
jgi:hypothetical protein